MGVDQVVISNVTRSTSFPTRRGFGIPAFIAYHTLWPETVRAFGSLQELVDLGVPTYHPVYRGAAALKRANPGPRSFVVAKRATAFSQTQTLTINDATAGKVYAFNVVSPDGTVTAISRTVPGASTTTAEATAIASQIDAAPGITAAGSVAVITVTTTAAGDYAYFTDLPGQALVTYADTTADPGIAADLNTIKTATKTGGPSVSWYGGSFDRLGEAEMSAVGSWFESEKLIAWLRSSDSAIMTSSTTDVASDLQDLSLKNVAGLFAQKHTGDHREFELLALQLAKEPGAWSPAWKQLPGIANDDLTTGEEGFIQGKAWSTYTDMGGQNVVFEGKTPNGEFLDTTFAIHFTEARIQEAIIGIFLRNDIVLYDQGGIDLILTTVQATLLRLSANPNPIYRPETVVVTPILVDDVDDADKAIRRLTGIAWTAKLSGAIHGATVNGTVTL